MNNELKTVVITGATSGIGNLLVKKFSSLGWKVFAGYRNESHRNALESVLNVTPFYIDMSKRETILAASKFVCEQTQKIDVLINAAGCVIAGPMECLDTGKIREQFDVNTFSHLEFTQGLFLKLEKGAKIINISSEASFGIFPFIAPYCASKRALDILFNSMQIECGNDIKIVSIKPGVIKTPLWNKSIEGNKDVLVDSLVGVLGDDKKYEKEFDFLMKNAEKNNYRGLEPEKVAEFIYKISMLKNPKPSYTIGLDAKCAEILSHLPLGVVNFLVKKGLEMRVGKSKL